MELHGCCHNAEQDRSSLRAPVPDEARMTMELVDAPPEK